eukprot:ANDGO_05827.mRNA.1 hypothetical protein
MTAQELGIFLVIFSILLTSARASDPFQALSLAKVEDGYQIRLFRTLCQDPEVVGKISMLENPLDQYDLAFTSESALDDLPELRFFGLSSRFSLTAGNQLLFEKRSVLGFDFRLQMWIDVPALPEPFVSLRALTIAGNDTNFLTRDFPDQPFALFAIAANSNLTSYAFMRWVNGAASWSLYPGAFPAPDSRIGPDSEPVIRSLSIGHNIAAVCGFWAPVAPVAVLESVTGDWKIHNLPASTAEFAIGNSARVLPYPKNTVLVTIEMFDNASYVPFAVLNATSGVWDPATLDAAKSSSLVFGEFSSFESVAALTTVVGRCPLGSCFYVRYWPDFKWVSLGGRYTFPTTSGRAVGYTSDPYNVRLWIRTRENGSSVFLLPEVGDWSLIFSQPEQDSGFSWPVEDDASVPCTRPKPRSDSSSGSDDSPNKAAIIGGVCGGVAVLGAVGVFCFLKRRKRSQYGSVA